MPNPIDRPLTFEGHPDQAQPLEALDLFGMRVRGNIPTEMGKQEEESPRYRWPKVGQEEEESE